MSRDLGDMGGMTLYCIVVDDIGFAIFLSDGIVELEGPASVSRFSVPPHVWSTMSDTLRRVDGPASLASSASGSVRVCNNPLILVFSASASSPLPSQVGGTVSASLNIPRGLPETSRRFFGRFPGSWIT